MVTVKTVLLGVVAALLLAALVVFALGWHWLNTERALSENDRVLMVEPGASLYSLSRQLQAQGVLRWPKLLIIYARLTGATGIKVGEYALAERESPVSLLNKLRSGLVIQHQITLVEGESLREWLVRLQREDALRHTLNDQNLVAMLQPLGFAKAHPEGWFFPDTYNFTRGDSDAEILARAHKKMVAVLQEEWAGRAADLPYANEYQALIMASIVEKETGAVWEREQIAGVFVRRLQKNMRLQTDPTVIYGMGERYRGNITRADLKTSTPYNTYLIRGLPPTPIAMPGREALRAALHPDAGSALYFVAKGDGSHQFSTTLEDHIRAVNKFQKRRREDYRSSPPSEPLNNNDASGGQGEG